MVISGRNYNAANAKDYTYGFNGKMNDNEVKGEGNSVDFGARVYDSRIGRFLSVDRLSVKLPFCSPYIFAGNKPIGSIDYNGDVEVIVNTYETSKDGKTRILKYTNKYNIETVEDLQGIHRDAIIINIETKIITVRYYNGPNSYTDWDQPAATKAYVQPGSGQSYEDRTWAGTEGKVAKAVYKTLVKLWPPAKIADAWGDDGTGTRDPVTGAYRDPAKKYLQTGEAIFDVITLGRGALAKEGFKKGMEKLGMTYFKKLVDWGAEEVIKTATEKLGLGSDKANILGYYFLKYAADAKAGEIKSLFKILETAVKLAHKGQDAITDLKNGGIDLNLPQGKADAAQQALDSERQQTTPMTISKQ